MSRLALACFIAASFLARAASAADDAISLWAPGEGCPSSDLVRHQLVPLIGARPIELAPSESALAVVRDDGERYSIVVGKAQHDVLDASRNCLERGRCSISTE